MTDVHPSNVTPAQVRDIVLHGLISSGPGKDEKYMPTSRELDTLHNMCASAVTSGRLIDFGFWPNAVIKESGNRGGILYNESALGHPFSEPYLIMHTWSDPKLHADLGMENYQASCVYLINPFPQQGETCISFEACTFETLTIANERTLCVGDRLWFHGDMSKGRNDYCANVIPFAHRWLSEPRMLAAFQSQLTDGRNFESAAAANVLDPLMTALMILNTRGVKQETVAPSPKLARARARSGKTPIPPYRRVDSQGYVTALLARSQGRHGPSLGGTHASPVMHLRRGHWRNYETGQRSFIRDTLVNADETTRAQFVATRSHYTVKED